MPVCSSLEQRVRNCLNRTEHNWDANGERNGDANRDILGDESVSTVIPQAM